MSGYEEDCFHSKGDCEGTIQGTLLFRERHFSDRYSLPERANYGNTMHSRQKCHLSRQNPAFANT